MSIEDYTLEYYSQNAKKLRSMVDNIIKHFGGIHDRDHFYSLANEVFVHDILKHYDGESNFDAFAYSCLKKKIFSELTHINRDYQTPYARDPEGEKIKDKDGNYIRIPIISLDVPMQDDSGKDVSYYDIVKSDYNLEDSVLANESNKLNISEYFNRLSKKQQTILLLLMNEYKGVEIQDLLHISSNEYNDHLMNIRSYENISILLSGR